MNHIKKFESWDNDAPVFNFDQTFHVVGRNEISSWWDCLSCDNIWENFNKIYPSECPKCSSKEIEEIESGEEDDLLDLYSLKKAYENLNPESHQEVINEVKSLIESTIEKSGGEFSTFVESMVKEPEKFKIEGLINDSDIYDFYLKYRNDIDEILNDVKFYDEVPSEINVFGLYDYIITGTNRAVQEVVKMIK